MELLQENTNLICIKLLLGRTGTIARQRSSHGKKPLSVFANRSLNTPVTLRRKRKAAQALWQLGIQTRAVLSPGRGWPPVQPRNPREAVPQVRRSFGTQPCTSPGQALASCSLLERTEQFSLQSYSVNEVAHHCRSNVIFLCVLPHGKWLKIMSWHHYIKSSREPQCSLVINNSDSEEHRTQPASEIAKLLTSSLSQQLNPHFSE